MSKCPQCGYIKATRSLPQNALYWKAYVEPMALEAGCTTEEMHKSLVNELLSEKIMVKTKYGIEFRETSGSTTSLTKKQFSDYLERVAQIASEIYDIVIDTEG